jgi:hypothetical protein
MTLTSAWPRGAVVFGVYSLTASMAYAAGHHQICYQGPPVGNPAEPTVVVECRTDVPLASCTASLPGSTTWSGSGSSVPGANRITTFKVTPNARHTAIVEFTDGTRRECSTAVGYAESAYDAWNAFAVTGHLNPFAPTAPRLLGYMTDESGLLMSGVWSSSTTLPSSTVIAPQAAPKNTIHVPRDFIVVGGGAVGSRFPNGALLTDMDLSWPDVSRGSQWNVRTEDSAQFGERHTVEALAIAIKIEGVTWMQLAGVLMRYTGQWSPVAAHPKVQVMPPAGHVVIGGSATARVETGQFGQFLTASIPVPAIHGLCWGGTCGDNRGAIGWYGAAKDHAISAPGRVWVWLVSIAESIEVPLGSGRRFRVVTDGRGVTSAGECQEFRV